MFDLQDELKKLPDKPGVYLMHDKDDVIIYVGKASCTVTLMNGYVLSSVSIVL